MQRVGGDDAAHEVHRVGAQEFLRGGQFVAFVRSGDEGHGGAVLVLDEADDEAEVLADGFAIQGQRGGQTSGLGRQPAGEHVGQDLNIQGD